MRLERRQVKIIDDDKDRNMFGCRACTFPYIITRTGAPIRNTANDVHRNRHLVQCRGACNELPFHILHIHRYVYRLVCCSRL